MYHTGISQMSKYVQVLSGTFPKRGTLLQCIRSGDIRHVNRTPCISKSRKNFKKHIFDFKHERWMLKWGKYTWVPEKVGLSVFLKQGEDNQRLRQDRRLAAGWHQKFHDVSPLQKRPLGQGILWSFQDYRNMSENLDSNICKYHCGLVILGLKVRFTIKHVQEY